MHSQLSDSQSANKTDFSYEEGAETGAASGSYNKCLRDTLSPPNKPRRYSRARIDAVKCRMQRERIFNRTVPCPVCRADVAELCRNAKGAERMEHPERRARAALRQAAPSQPSVSVRPTSAPSLTQLARAFYSRIDRGRPTPRYSEETKILSLAKLYVRRAIELELVTDPAAAGDAAVRVG